MKSHLRLVPVLVALLLLISLQSQAIAGGAEFQLKYFKKGGDFTLTDHNGKKTSLKEYRGKVVLLFFGYLLCPDVCPTTLTDAKLMMQLLGDKADQVQVLFVTVDPDRDSAEALKSFIEAFDKRFLGLRGTKKEIDEVAKKYAARYRFREVDNELKYQVDHTAWNYLIDQDGQLRAMVPYTAPAEYLAEGVRKLL